MVQAVRRPGAGPRPRSLVTAPAGVLRRPRWPTGGAPVSPGSSTPSRPPGRLDRPGTPGARSLRALLLGGLLLGLGACGGLGAPAPAGDDGKPVVGCGRLTRLVAGLPGLGTLDSREVKADEPGHPAHCLVTGQLNERRARDGAHHAIRFELRLPQPWNRRFLHQLNGGTDGVVKPAFGDLGVLDRDALMRGFAVLSSDGGHDGADPAHADAGLAQATRFGLDPQARRDYGHQASAALYPVAQALIKAYYGQSPQRNYMAGCSNGGRQAMVAASRQGDRYDGFLAGAPGFNLPRAALQHAWDVQSWRLAHPDIRKAFSPADLQRVADHVRARCDALDLLVDGMVSDFRRCQQVLRLGELRCKSGESNSAGNCLADGQVTALEKALAGPRNSRGESLYSDWPLDTGIASANWRAWKLESTVPAWDRMPIIAVMGAASLAQVFSTPPQPVAGTPAALLDSLLRFDFDRDAGRIAAKLPPFDESALELMTPPDVASPQLAGLRAARGKLLIYHGVSDPVFSVNDTLRWVERLQANLGYGAASATARVFPVPGMAHCQGGPATDRFDALGALVDWVEKGQAPESIVARVSPANTDLPRNWPLHRSRPLCPWPLVARYAGGDVESASSFRCAAP